MAGRYNVFSVSLLQDRGRGGQLGSGRRGAKRQGSSSDTGWLLYLSVRETEAVFVFGQHNLLQGLCKYSLTPPSLSGTSTLHLS